MLYLANGSSPKVREAMTRSELGQMCTPAERRAPLDGVTWAADNGCFGKGYPGDDAWVKFAESLIPHLDRVAFVVAPDVFLPEQGVGDAVATLERSLPWLRVIRGMGFPAAFVAQDGCEVPGMVPWPDLDVLFVGGGDAWKKGRRSQVVIEEALARGKRVHMGRCVNGLSSMWSAHERGCHSSDSTFLRYGPNWNVRKIVAWLDVINHQDGLFPRVGEVS